jgi:hypothetical protein
MAVWTPKNWEEVCKRNAGRRKLHMRKRQARADRILRLLNAFGALPELRESSYGWLALAAEQTNTSRATASRDLALCRRIQTEFALMFGRLFNPKTDRILWSWDWSHYGFQTSESLNSGHSSRWDNSLSARARIHPSIVAASGVEFSLQAQRELAFGTAGT